MNERIRELAGQRGLTGPNYLISSWELERFAKLIVRECAEVAACNGHVSGFSLGDLIKEHFGVEEEEKC